MAGDTQDTRQEMAVRCVKGLLIETLQENKFCQAREIGRALEILIENTSLAERSVEKKDPAGGESSGMGRVA